MKSKTRSYVEYLVLTDIIVMLLLHSKIWRKDYPHWRDISTAIFITAIPSLSLPPTLTAAHEAENGAPVDIKSTI